MKSYMFDTEFLRQLNSQKRKETFIKIISLTMDEEPLEQIEGKVTGGSVSIDGKSAVRRTCNLTFIAKDVNINDFYWSVSNKFILELGVRNEINTNYPDIIWFKQGVFVITSFSSTLTQNNFTISISGKDKMCLLNGDMGGSLPASIDFGKMDEQNKEYTKIEFSDHTTYVANKYYVYDNNLEKYVLSTQQYNPNETYYSENILINQQQIRLNQIIREAVHVYGKEPYHNIVINGVDNYGLELLQYRGDEAFYLLYSVEEDIYDQIVSEVEMNRIFSAEGIDKETFVFNSAVDEFTQGSQVILKGLSADGKVIYKPYTITKIENGQVAGYRTTDLVYAGELISNIGESLTSILDKIKQMLGPFEYFYDVDGRFIFQAQPSYENISWNSTVSIDGNIFARDANEVSAYSYSFEDVELIQKFQNTPALNNLKNDYSVWGTRTSVTGAKIPIHARYAIHSKPQVYKSIDGVIYCSDASIFSQIKRENTTNTSSGITTELLAFEHEYAPTGTLPTPQLQSDGSWSPGWWDIRDFARYYSILKREEPRGTMKFYAHNNPNGYQKLSESLPNVFSEDPTYKDFSAWLLIVTNPEGVVYSKSDVIVSHGAGVVTPDDKKISCDYYESYWGVDDYGRPDLKTNLIKAGMDTFGTPFKGCANTHTYLHFMTDYVDKGSRVFFYNPKFPGATSLQGAIDQEVEKRVDDKLIAGEIQIVDWREIIYQMAKDYYKHGTKSDFTIKVQNNNSFSGFLEMDETFSEHEGAMVDSYYPGGITGYEMFYEDIYGFWRELYDTDPKKIYHTIGGNYTVESYYKAQPTSDGTAPWGASEEKAKQFYLKNNETERFEPIYTSKISWPPTYNSSLEYYTTNQEYAIEELYQAFPNKAEFEKNKKKYYVLKYKPLLTKEDYDNGIAPPPFDPKQQYYIRKKFGRVAISKEEYNTNRGLYYYYNSQENTYVSVGEDLFNELEAYFVELAENDKRYELINLQEDDYLLDEFQKVSLTSEEFAATPCYIYNTETGKYEQVNPQYTTYSSTQTYYMKTEINENSSIFTYYIKDTEENDPSKYVYEAAYAEESGKVVRDYSYDPLCSYMAYEKSHLYVSQDTWHEFEQLDEYDCDYFLSSDQGPLYWHKNVVEAPELLNYWLDFYEGSDDLSRYGIDKIGDRTKVVNDSKVTSVYFRKTPQVVFTSQDEYDPLARKSGYVYIWLTDEMKDLFTISAQGKSAEEEVENLFNQHSYCSEVISLSVIPIYDLEPNTIINIHNEDSGINGEYKVDKISIPLTSGGLMTISATKMVKRI